MPMLLANAETFRSFLHCKIFFGLEIDSLYMFDSALLSLSFLFHSGTHVKAFLDLFLLKFKGRTLKMQMHIAHFPAWN